MLALADWHALVNFPSPQAENNRKAPSLKELLSDEQAGVRCQIVELFREHKTSKEIAQLMNGALSGGVRSDEATASLVRKLIVKVVSPEERRTHESEMHRLRAHRNHSAQNAGRDDALRKKGMKVWTLEEHAYFLELISSDEYVRSEQRATRKKGTRKRRKHFNHDALAKAMNEHFNTMEFTSERTMGRLEHLRSQTKRRTATENGKPLVPRSKRKSELPANELGELNNAVTVPPLVVVPGEHFEQVRALDLREVSVDDAGMRVADKVL